MSDVAKLERQLEKLVAEGAASSRILGTAERLLVLLPTHAVALRHKAVCCIHADKFGAALAALAPLTASTTTAAGRTHAAPVQSAALHDVPFLRAYCLYRMHQYAEAKAVLQREGDDAHALHTPARHLLAQIHYNLEEYAQAAALYADMARHTDDADELHELTVNRTAALVACDAHAALRCCCCAAAGDDGNDGNGHKTTLPTAREDVTALSVDAIDGDDVLYNAAAAQLALGAYAQALHTLRRAESLCAQQHPSSRVRGLADVCALDARDNADAVAGRVAWLAAPPPGHSAAAAAVTPERRFFADVANTWVQMAFAYDALGSSDVARNILQLVLHAKPPSAVTSAMASINYAAVQLRQRNGSSSGDDVDNNKKAATAAQRHGAKQHVHADVFDAQHRLRSAQAVKATRRLTSRQSLALLYNTALLHLECGNVVRCRQVVEQMAREHALHPLTHSLQLALALRERRKKRQGGGSNNSSNNNNDGSGSNSSDATATTTTAGDDDAAVQELLQRYEASLEQVAAAALSTTRRRRGGSSSAVAAATQTPHARATARRCVQAQMALELGDVRAAIAALASLPHAHTTASADSGDNNDDDDDLSCWPATLATLTAWRMQVGDEATALQALTNAVTHVRDDDDDDGDSDARKRSGGRPVTAAAPSRGRLSTRAAKSLLVWAVHYLTTLATSSASSSTSSSSSVTSARSLYGECAELLRRARAAVPALRADRDTAALLVLCLAHVDVDAAREVAAQDLSFAYDGRPPHDTSPSSALHDHDTKSRQSSGSSGSGDAAAAAPHDTTPPTRAHVERAGYRRPTALDATAQSSSQQQQQRRRRHRAMRRPPKILTTTTTTTTTGGSSGRPDPERWLPMSMRSYIKDLPARRKKELRRLRALEQEQKRKAAERRKAEQAAAAAAAV